MVSSSCPCRCTAVGSASSNQSCYIDPAWQRLRPVSCFPGRPAATDNDRCPAETSPQRLKKMHNTRLLVVSIWSLFALVPRKNQRKTERQQVSLAFCKCYVCSRKRVLKGTTWGGRELQDKLQQPCNLPKPAFMDLAAGVHCAWSISWFLCGASWVGVFYSKIYIFLSSFRQLMWL